MCALRPEYNERLQFVQALPPKVVLKDHVKFSNANVSKVMKFVKVSLFCTFY